MSRISPIDILDIGDREVGEGEEEEKEVEEEDKDDFDFD